MCLLFVISFIHTHLLQENFHLFSETWHYSWLIAPKACPSLELWSYCPGFSWYRGCFLPCSWYSSVFWIWYRIMLTAQWCFGCCQLVLNLEFSFSHALSVRSCTSCFEDIWDSCPKLAKGIFHTTECQAQSTNWRKLILRGPEDCWKWGGHWL